MTWHNKCVCDSFDDLTPEERWLKLYGTEFIGNLPTYKKNKHVGSCWNPCPYSTDCQDGKSVIMLGLNDVSDITKTEHMYNGRKHYMRPYHKVSVWGYICTDPNCPHFLNNGEAYFYR
jgi:hypothetical protein